MNENALCMVVPMDDMLRIILLEICDIITCLRTLLNQSFFEIKI
jgi:hypothetical protein